MRIPVEIGPLTTGHACRILGLTSRIQLEKLIGASMLSLAMPTDGGHRRLESEAVLGLAGQPEPDGPGPGAGHDLAVHLAPLQRDPDALANERTHLGFHRDAAAQGLNALQIEYAWAGMWKCNPRPYVGSNLVGVVCGFVVAVAPIHGYRIINGLVRFAIGTPSPELEAHYLEHRIRARQGPPYQAL